MRSRAILSVSLLLLLQCTSAGAQKAGELNEIYEAAKTLYVKPETLDRLLIRMRSIEADLPEDQEALLLETYRIISDQYVSNNHYSQAFQVQLKYTELKENYTARKFTKAIDTTRKNIQLRRTTDGTELMNLQNQVQQLQIDNDLLISKRLSFRKYFSLIIIILSSLFAIMLVRSAVKLYGIRNQLKENRDRMKSVHRLAVIGSLSNGLAGRIRLDTISTEESSRELLKLLENNQALNKEATDQVKNINLQCKEIIKSLNTAGI